MKMKFKSRTELIGFLGLTFITGLSAPIIYMLWKITFLGKTEFCVLFNLVWVELIELVVYPLGLIFLYYYFFKKVNK